MRPTIRTITCFSFERTFILSLPFSIDRRPENATIAVQGHVSDSCQVRGWGSRLCVCARTGFPLQNKLSPGSGSNRDGRCSYREGASLSRLPFSPPGVQLGGRGGFRTLEGPEPLSAPKADAISQLGHSPIVGEPSRVPYPGLGAVQLLLSLRSINRHFREAVPEEDRPSRPAQALTLREAE